MITQTLQYIFDLSAAIKSSHRALKPGGVLLLTAPSGATQPTAVSGVRLGIGGLPMPSFFRLLREVFREGTVTVQACGNILVATAFHYGIALEELDRSVVDVADSGFPIVVTARAVKRDNI